MGVVNFDAGNTPIVSSVQYVDVEIPFGSFSATATLGNAVDTARSIAVLVGIRTEETVARHATASVALTNGTTVTAARQSSWTGTGAGKSTWARVAVIEFLPGVVSSVARSISTAAAVSPTTQTVSSVDTSRTLVFPQGVQGSANTAANLGYFTAMTWLSNSTTMSFQSFQPIDGVAAQIVEFAPGIIEATESYAFPDGSDEAEAYAGPLTHYYDNTKSIHWPLGNRGQDEAIGGPIGSYAAGVVGGDANPRNRFQIAQFAYGIKRFYALYVNPDLTPSINLPASVEVDKTLLIWHNAPQATPIQADAMFVTPSLTAADEVSFTAGTSISSARGILYVIEFA